MRSPIPLPPYSRTEEICNMVTHIVGGALGVAALVLCVVRAALRGDVWSVVSSAVYGVSIILLFTMSSIYHGLIPVKAKKVFRVIDHCTIYILIAGTYTPIVLVALRPVSPVWAWILFGIVWTAAIVALVLTAVDMMRFRVFSMIAYLAMGWCVVIRIHEVARVIGAAGMVFLVTGGVLYTVGAILYAVSKKKNMPYAHTVFHVFVLFACICHFFTVYCYVL